MRAAGPDRHVKPLLDLDACRKFRLRPVFFNAHCAHGNCPGGIIPGLAAVGRTHVGPFSDVPFDPAELP